MSFNPVALAVLRKRIDDAFDHVDNFQTMFCEFTHTGRKLANWNTNDAMIFLARVSCFKKNEPVNFCANAEFFFTFEKFNSVFHLARTIHLRKKKELISFIELSSV